MHVLFGRLRLDRVYSRFLMIYLGVYKVYRLLLFA